MTPVPFTVETLSSSLKQALLLFALLLSLFSTCPALPVSLCYVSGADRRSAGDGQVKPLHHIVRAVLRQVVRRQWRPACQMPRCAQQACSTLCPSQPLLHSRLQVLQHLQTKGRVREANPSVWLPDSCISRV